MSDLGRLMEKYWEKEEEEEKKTSQRIHPSIFSTLCLREYYHVFRGDVSLPPFSPRIRRILSRSTFVHEEIRKIWKEMGILRGDWKCHACNKVFKATSPENCKYCHSSYIYYQETRMTKRDWMMVGYADAFLDIEGKKYLAEIKSTNAQNFRSICAPRVPHILQVHCYMEMSGIDSAWIVYVERDRGDFKTFFLEKNMEIINRIDRNCKLLIECLDKEIPPPLNFSETNKYCMSNCSASALCRDNKQEFLPWMNGDNRLLGGEVENG